MSDDVETWPPIDLIAGLATEAPPIEEELDPDVLKELPEGTEVVSIHASGASAWVQTVCIDTLQKNGERKRFFKKHQAGNLGRRMMLGTYESEKAVHTYIPENVPKPIAWGTYQADDDMHLYLADFHEMVAEDPDPVQFVDIVVKLHQESLGKAPYSKFGFHISTHLANVPIQNRWQETWETFYSEILKEMMEIEAVSQGSDDTEFEELKKKTLAFVVPRLLRPLETNGRKVTPCLLYTDLWPGNCMPDAQTGSVILFDSCAVWGHHEADLGSWRAPRYRMGKPFMEEYQRRMGMEHPADEWDDRNLLYALRYDLLNSALFPNTDKLRKDARDSMKFLTDKYPGGFDA